METILHSFLLSMPQAAAIWLIMLGVALVAVLALSTPGQHGRADDPADGDADPLRRGHRGAQADERDWTRRYANEVAVAAERATVTAHRARGAWEAAHDAVDRAWRCFDAADRAARRAAQAVAFPSSHPVRSPAEFADRERYLHRAATAACRRQELTIDELSDALAHRNGWDPRLPPVQQEAFLRRVVRDRLFRAYCEAQHLEQRAWQAAGVASAAMCSLRQEAMAAALQAGTVTRSAEPSWWAEQWATDPVRANAPAPAVADQLLVPAAEPVLVLAAEPVLVPVGADADATQPLRPLVAGDSEVTQALPVPAQTRVARRSAPHPVNVRSAPAIRQPAAAGSAMVTS